MHKSVFIIFEIFTVKKSNQCENVSFWIVHRKALFILNVQNVIMKSFESKKIKICFLNLTVCVVFIDDNRSVAIVSKHLELSILFPINVVK